MVHSGPLSPQPGLGSLPAAWLGVLPPPHSPGSFPSQGCGLATSSFVSCQSDLVTSSQSLRGSFSQPQNICVTSSLRAGRSVELRLLLSCSWLQWVPRLLPHTQASPGQGWRGWREGGRLADRCLLSTAYSLHGEDRRGSPGWTQGHRHGACSFHRRNQVRGIVVSLSLSPE